MRSWRPALILWIVALGLPQLSSTSSALASPTGCTASRSVSVGTSLFPNGGSWDPAVSADGRYVAFSSFASNLLDDPVVTDSNGVSDVFLQDRVAGEMLLVSSARSGAQGNAASSQPDVSGDGEYVVYQSAASNLIAADTNAASDIFRFDIADGRTVRVSVANNGAQSNGESGTGGPSTSADGSVVAFASDATNLVAGDTNGTSDIFVRDLAAGTTRRVSVSSSGAQADGPSYMGAISGDGNYVVFSSSADNLVSGDTNGTQDVFIRNLSTGNTALVSAATTGVQGNSDSISPAVSSDGRYVAFTSSATNLIPGDDNFRTDVFLRDRQVGTTTLASRSYGDATVAADASFDPAVTVANHVLVAFASNAYDIWNPANPPPAGTSQIYEYDATTGVPATRLSVTSDDQGGTAQWGNGDSFGTDISTDGLFAAFRSTSTNLGESGGSVYGDVFSHQWVQNRTKCKSEERSRPFPIPLPYAPLGPPPEKPDADDRCQDYTTSRPLGADPLPGLPQPQWFDWHSTNGAVDEFSVTLYPNLEVIWPDQEGKAYLRNGNTYWSLKAKNQRGQEGNWEGWGYRKTAAKHGWGPDVKDQVALVLEHADTVGVNVEIYGTRYIYSFVYAASPGSIPCERTVVVQWGRPSWQKTKDYPAVHIITTYAWAYTGPRPTTVLTP